MPEKRTVLQPLLCLLEQRVGLRLEANATQTLAAFDALADQLKLSQVLLLERLTCDPALLEKLATQLTIAETHFFRIAPQIAALRELVLPELERRLAGKRPLSLWSAGCSTGEEAYTLAILAAQGLSARTELWILGTDLHPDSLEAARRGSYRAWSFRDTPEHVRERYFRKSIIEPASHQSPEWQIAAKLRGMVRFELHNLLSADWQAMERFDLILCRNVMIYFSNFTAQRLIERLAAQLQPSGWLILGPSDPPPLPATLEHCGLSVRYVPGAIIYQKNVEQKNALQTATEVKTVAQPPEKSLRPLATLELPLSEAQMLGFGGPIAQVFSQPVNTPADFETELQLGMSALERDDLPAALEALRRAAYLEPQSALAQFLLAKTLLDSAQPTRARVALRQAERWLPISDSSGDLQRAISALSVMLGEP